MATPQIRVGILNLMHDKVDTQQRFTRVLTRTAYPVTLTFFYPRTHYRGRAVPDLVQRIAQPLEFDRLSEFNAFIITGAPIEQLEFDAVTYIDEIHRLIDRLGELDIPQLYICWGAMAAANYLYGIDKHRLKEKLFGVFPNHIVNRGPLLAGLPDGFLAPHARYAELDHQQILTHPDLILEATTVDDDLFSFRARQHQQFFLFAHLEYGREALLKEYRREKNAYPDREYAKPQNYFLDPVHMRKPQFKWQPAQQLYFANWLQTVAHDMQNKKLVKE
jgi:homoserine O-succinyltransferase